MTPLVLIITLLVCIVSVSAFYAAPTTRTFSSALSMAKGEKGGVSKALNMPRKLKRKLRGLDNTNFDSFLSAETDDYLKNTAQGAVYENLMKQINKKARELKVTVKTGFGVKAIVVLPDLVELAVKAGTFTTLVKAVQAAGLVDTLKGKDPLTVFAPSDEAFAKLPEGTLEGLLADIPKLSAILTYHVIPGHMTSKKVIALGGKTTPTVNGKEVSIKVGRQDNVVQIDEAKIVTADLKALNGYIHVIDSVLIPKE